MDERSVRQILLARYYLHLAAEQLASPAEPARFAAINLYHEALETTLVTCADHLNANVPERSGFEQYLDRINQRMDGQELPFRNRILRFNRARVAAKHHLTLPDDSFFNLLETVVPEFIRAAVQLVFGKDLEEISLIDLIEEHEVSTYLSEAQSLLASSQFYDCLVAARKAFYVQFEKEYDIREFSDPEKANSASLLSPFSLCRAPSYAKRPEYIQKSVSRPSDYIVLDHSAIDSELMKDGVDVQIFWNIWRLTPEIYQFDSGEWCLEYDFDIADDPSIKDSCVYVIDNLISITLQRQSRRKRSRSKTGARRYIQTIANAPVYTKADQRSEISGRLPDGVRRVNVDRAVPALEGKGFYWQASYLRKGGPWLFGYISSTDTEGEPQFGFVADGIDLAHAISGYLEPEGSQVKSSVQRTPDD